MKKHKEFFNIIWSKHRQNANKNNHFKRQPTGKTTRQGHKVNSLFVLHISDVLNITAQILDLCMTFSSKIYRHICIDQCTFELLLRYCIHVCYKYCIQLVYRNVLDFKMKIIKWKWNFVSCNFGLKSNL